jgi:hypothetical protein
MGNFEGKRLIGRHRYKYENNNKMYLRGIGCGYELHSSGSGEISVTEFCEHGNEPFDSVKYWGFLEWLSDCSLLKKVSAPWR